MKTSPHKLRRRLSSGYSLIELVVAATILTIGVAAAAKLSLISVTQDEINQRVAVSLAHQEIAMRLYQLGLDPAEITALLPDEPGIASLTFTTGQTTVGGAPITPIDYAESTMIVNSTPAGTLASGEWNGGGDTAAAETRTSIVRAHRYANRYR